MKHRNLLFGFALGLLCMFVFGLAAAIIDSEKAYTVHSVDDHLVTLKSETGNFISVSLENTPAVSCLEVGSTWIIDYR